MAVAITWSTDHVLVRGPGTQEIGIPIRRDEELERGTEAITGRVVLSRRAPGVDQEPFTIDDSASTGTSSVSMVICVHLLSSSGATLRAMYTALEFSSSSNVSVIEPSRRIPRTATASSPDCTSAFWTVMRS
jgi:hypothetical protein